MPLSKALDRERKRLARLESKKVQPNGSYIGAEWVQGGEYVQIRAEGQTIDADGVVQPIPNCPDGRYRDATE